MENFSGFLTAQDAAFQR